MTMAFGGSGKYDGKSMAAAHKRMFEQMGLTAEHFDMVAGHLLATLEDMKVPRPLVDEVVAVVGPLRAIFEEGEAVSGIRFKGTARRERR